jgi:hypothetical protein
MPPAPWAGPHRSTRRWVTVTPAGFLSFMLGDQRPIKEFGFGLAATVFLDALLVCCPPCSNCSAR